MTRPLFVPASRPTVVPRPSFVRRTLAPLAPLGRLGQLGRLGRLVGMAIAIAVAVAVAACGRGGASRPAELPDILLVVIDDVGYGGLGCYGAEDYGTPNLDTLARDGLRFTSAYVTTPFCSPSRSGLLTGRYNQRFGHDMPTAANRGLPPEETTLAEALRARGYRTGLVGKWHSGAAPEHQPLRHGFDSFFGFVGAMHPYLLGGRDDRLQRDGTPVAFESGHLTDVLTDEAIDFVRRDRRDGRPWFLMVSYLAAHRPLEAPPELVERFAGIDDARRRVHAATMTSLDDNVGRLLDALRDDGLDERTLVLVTSDNGGPTRVTGASNRPLRGTKGELLEGGIRVPMLMRFPNRLPAGRVVDEPALHLDLFATALSAAGAPRPEAEAGDGLDWLARATESAPPETGSPARTGRALFFRKTGERAIREGRWKLLVDREGHRLYDVVRDPGEREDVAAAHPAVVERLERRWQAWNADLPPPSPHADPSSRGGAGRRRVVDLAVERPAWTSLGTERYDYHGASIASGDFDGDGHADLAIGAILADGPGGERPDCDRVTIRFGPLSAASRTTVVHGARAGDVFGLEVAVIDFDGDGTDDLAVAAPRHDGPGGRRADAGAVHVVLGRKRTRAPFPPVLDLADTPADCTIHAPDPDDPWATSLLFLPLARGDLDGDGRDDLVLGLPGADGPRGDRPTCGEAHVLFGASPRRRLVDLREESDFVVHGSDARDLLGAAVAFGDVNGDGIDDLLVGAKNANGPRDDALQTGEVVGLFGRPNTWPRLIDLDEGLPSAGDRDGGFVAYGVDALDRAGRSIATGDFDGDGIDDLAIGARHADGRADDPNLESAGEVRLVLGSRDLGGTLDLASAARVEIHGAGRNDSLGFRVALADLDGDGSADLVTTAPYESGAEDARTRAGEAVVVFGGADRAGLLDLTRDPPPLRIRGAAAWHSLGTALCLADLDGDGPAEIALGGIGRIYKQLDPPAPEHDAGSPPGRVVVLGVDARPTRAGARGPSSETVDDPDPDPESPR